MIYNVLVCDTQNLCGQANATVTIRAAPISTDALGNAVSAAASSAVPGTAAAALAQAFALLQLQIAQNGNTTGTAQASQQLLQVLLNESLKANNTYQVEAGSGRAFAQCASQRRL